MPNFAIRPTGSNEYAIIGGGHRAVAQLLRPGVLKIATPGENHIVVGHASIYVDAEVTLLADGTMSLARLHATWRFGQEEPLPEVVRSVTEQVVRDMSAALAAGHGATIGVAGTNQIGLELHQRLAATKRHLRVIEVGIDRNLRAIEAASTQLTAQRERHRGFTMELEGIQASIEVAQGDGPGSLWQCMRGHVFRYDPQHDPDQAGRPARCGYRRPSTGDACVDSAPLVPVNA